MQISITEDEIKAIDFGLEQIREALEGSSDDDYKKCADEAINKLESISRKYHLARVHIPKHTRSLSGSLLGYKTIP